MSVTRVAISIVVVIIFLSSVFFATRNMQTTMADNPVAPVVSPTQEVTIRQLVSVTPTPGLTDVPVVTVSRQIPRFYGTVTYGSNRSFALTEDQAWTFAEDYLAKAGVTSIQAYEVVPLGQSIRKDAADNQDVVWSFRVDRIESGVNKGGIITIDAYTGEVVEYAGFL